MTQVSSSAQYNNQDNQATNQPCFGPTLWRVRDAIVLGQSYQQYCDDCYRDSAVPCSAFSYGIEEVEFELVKDML